MLAWPEQTGIELYNCNILTFDVASNGSWVNNWKSKVLGVELHLMIFFIGPSTRHIIVCSLLCSTLWHMHICSQWTHLTCWCVVGAKNAGALMWLIVFLCVGGGPRVVVSTAAFHARVRGSVPGLGGLKETKNVSSPSTCESQYCGESLWPRGSVLGLRPPGLEFRILCLGDSVISIILPAQEVLLPNLAYMCTKVA